MYLGLLLIKIFLIDKFPKIKRLLSINFCRPQKLQNSTTGSCYL